MPSRIARPALSAAIRQALGRSRAVALVGPRQVGKTTLARTLLPLDSSCYFDLENPSDLARLQPAMTALESLQGSGLVVIDEVQRRPDLFPILRVLIDRDDRPGQYLLLGSASPQLLRQSSESLAGRLEVIEVDPLALAEVGTAALADLWSRGGFPRSFTAATEEDSLRWREAFVQLTVARDLPELGLGADPLAIRRFWTMVAHYHGQIWNAADPARSLGVGESTVRRYLDFMTGAFLIRQLQPWYENLGKRQVKAPKVYVRDSGLLHSLLNLPDRQAVLGHPKAGASWEGLLLEQVLHHAKPTEAYFWATHQGAEIDLLMFKHGRRIGVEFKLSDAPKLTPSMRIAMADLKLDHLLVIYPGRKPYALAERVDVVPAARVAEFVA
jgi:predicted AAA+ superfamily ATPase